MDPVTYLEGWVRGWVHSRGCPPPAREPGGVLRVETGTAKECRRFVLLEPDEAILERLLARDHRPTTHVKLAGDPDRWWPLFGEGWEPDHPGWFMTRTLDDEPALEPPAGYEVRRETGEHLVVVEVLAADGRVAARGRCGVEGGWAVPDQIVTEAEHRRRGLGRLVMRELTTAARSVGAVHAVLGATVDGRELYRAMGWQTREPIVAGYYRPG